MEVWLTALDGRERPRQTKANLLIVSGVYKTLLTEGQWENIRPEGANRTPELNKSMISLVPYETNKILELLGESRCQIKAELGAETIITVYVIRGVQESLLGLRDAEALGILKINPEGDTMRTNADPPPGAEMTGEQTQEQIDQSMMETMKLFQKAPSDLGGNMGASNIQRPEEQTAEEVTTPQNARLRKNADIRSMGKAGEQICLHDPMLEHEFQGSNRFSIIYFNHTICQCLG